MQHIVSKSVASKLCNNLTPIAEGWLKETVLDYEHSFVLVNGMYMRAKEKSIARSSGVKMAARIDASERVFQLAQG